MDEGERAPSANAGKGLQLQFRPSPPAIARSRRARHVVATILLVGGAFFSGVMGYSLASGSVSGTLALAGIIGLVAGLATVLMLVRMILSRGPVAIGDGILNLGSSIRLRNGSRTRRVPLGEIMDVEPAVGPDGEHGVRILLPDGTTFFLDREEFQENGSEIMEKLSSTFGHDYGEELKEMLLAGRRAGFWVTKPVRIEDDHLVLRKKVYRYAGKSMKRIPLGDIAGTEEVSTHYSGPAVLVTLRDGSRFLLPQATVKALGLDQHPRWVEVTKR